MLQEVLTTVNRQKIKRFSNHQARFLMGVRQRVQATVESGDTEALLMLSASLMQIVDDALEGDECQRQAGQATP